MRFVKCRPLAYILRCPYAAPVSFLPKYCRQPQGLSCCIKNGIIKKEKRYDTATAFFKSLFTDRKMKGACKGLVSKMKYWFGISIGGVVCLLILELLPWGVATTFAVEPSRQVIRYYPYFHPLPYAYGNFGPFLTAVLTALLIILSVVSLCVKHSSIKWLTVSMIFTAAAICTSLMPFILFQDFTMIGVFISMLLVTVLILQLLAHQANSGEKRAKG